MASDIIAQGMAAAAGKKASLALEKVEGLVGGIKYIGEVDYYENLPSNPNLGDGYTVKYKTGSTNPDGREFVWGKAQDGTKKWIEFGPDWEPIITEIQNNIGKLAKISNPNLLINPDFSINQRGQKNYTGAGYGVDRWILVAGATLTPQSDGIKLIGACRQFYEEPNRLWGKTVTLSFKTTSGITSKSGTLPAVAPSANISLVSTNTDDSGVKANVMYVANKIAVDISATKEAKIYWVKLEIGSTATEFVPPLIEEELLKCQALRTDPVQLLRSNSEVFTGLVAGQPIEKIVFNPNVSIEKMTDYLSGLTYDEAIKYDQTAPEVQCVCKLVSIDWFDNSIAVYAIDFNAFSSMMGTSGYAIGVIDTSGDGFVVKQTVFATEYSEANLQLVTAMADKNYTVQYTQAGWNDTKDYVLNTNTNHMIVGVYDNKVSAFIGRDSRFFDVIEMLDDGATLPIATASDIETIIL